MKLKMFSVFDSKAEAFATPFFASTTGLAERSFQSLAMDPKSELFQHAADYCLFELGEFDQGQAHYVAHASPINLGTAIVFQARALSERRRTAARMEGGQVVDADERSEQEELS